MIDTLFDIGADKVSESKPVEHERRDWINLAAMAKIKDCPANWHLSSWEALEGGYLIVGSETTITKTGKRNWKPAKDRNKVIVTDADIQAQKDGYEAQTGNCWACNGTTEEWRGWNHETGHKWLPCRRCNATGKSP